MLGLSNDEWSHVGPLLAVPVAFAVAVVAALHTGRTARAAAWLTGAGLAGGAAAAWIFPLYSLSALALGAGLACLAATLWRGRAGTLARRPAGAGGRRMGAVRLLAGRHVRSRGDRGLVQRQSGRPDGGRPGSDLDCARSGASAAPMSATPSADLARRPWDRRSRIDASSG